MDFSQQNQLHKGDSLTTSPIAIHSSKFSQKVTKIAVIFTISYCIFTLLDILLKFQLFVSEKTATYRKLHSLLLDDSDQLPSMIDDAESDEEDDS